MNSGSSYMLMKKEKLDDDDGACEAEGSIDSGLGIEDLRSRNDRKRKAMREDQRRRRRRRRCGAEKQSDGYRAGLAEVDDARELLGFGFFDGRVHVEEDENLVLFADDDVGDLYTSLERAKKLTLHKQEDVGGSGPGAVASLAISAVRNSTSEGGENSPENKVVFTELGQFVWGLKLDENAREPEREDPLADKDEPLNALVEQTREEPGDRRSQAKGADHSSNMRHYGTLGEAAVGKGLSSVLKLLRERGTLKESDESSGRNTRGTEKGDFRKKEGFKDIRIERTDEFGRRVSEKEAFRLFCYRFHGKVPAKRKQEKRMKQFHEELKLKKAVIEASSTEQRRDMFEG